MASKSIALHVADIAYLTMLSIGMTIGFFTLIYCVDNIKQNLLY